MKPTTRTHYAARLERVLQWLSSHPQADPDLHHLAGLACLSPYHFHRVYCAVMGESVNDTVQRMRMQRAAVELSRGQDGLDRVARRAGYQSVAAFTRAFGASHGEPPGRYRAQRSLQRSSKEAVMYPVTIRAFPGLKLAALEHRGDYQRIGESFDRLGMLAVTHALLPEAPSGPWIGVYYDDPRQVAQAQLRSHAGVAVRPELVLPAALEPVMIPAVRCAVLDYVGPYSDIDAPYHWLFAEWLPQSGEEPFDFPMFEEYVSDPKTTPAAQLLTRIYMPLQG